MKKTLLFLLTIISINFLSAQTTEIPDPIFEQKLIDLGLDTGTPDGTVPTANIENVTSLTVHYENINDLTGIEDFTSLTGLLCSNNNLTSLDVSQNTALIFLFCGYNQISNLDVTQNIALTNLVCSFNYLTELDLSHNSALTEFNCFSNPLTCLNVQNGNNENFISFSSNNNSNLSCIEVDDVDYCNENWVGIGNGFSIDPGSSFSTNCPNQCLINVGVEEIDLNDFLLYPNPTSGNVTIDLGEIDQNIKATLTNCLGQVILIQKSSLTRSLNIDIDAPEGIYFIQIETSSGANKTFKVFKK